MSLELKPITTDDERAYWRELAERLAPVTVFQHPDWADILTRTYEAEGLPHLLTDGGQRAGVWPLFLTRRGGMKILASPLRGWATPYGGPLGPELPAEALRTLVESCGRELGAQYFEVTFPVEIDLADFTQAGYAHEDRQTLVLALDSDPEVVWKRMESRCRNSCRKAEKSGVEVALADEPDALDRYWEMAHAVYAKSDRLPPIPRELFAALWETMRAPNEVEPGGSTGVAARPTAYFPVARLEGAIVAAATILRFGTRWYYWDGVSDPAANKACPNNAIQWFMLQKMCAEGGTAYDMLGANNPAIAKFKQSFGAVFHPYHYVYKSWDWRAALGRSVYRRAAPILRAVKQRTRKASGEG